MNLIGNMALLAGRWLTAHHNAGNSRVSLATLGARVHKDAKLFERLKAGGSLSVERYEALVAYLADPANWPDGALPADARLDLAAMGIVQPGERLVIERDAVEREEVERRIWASEVHEDFPLAAAGTKVIP